MVEFLLESRRVLMVPGFFIKIYMYFLILLGFFLRQVVSEYIGITIMIKCFLKLVNAVLLDNSSTVLE